jgi:hypothetical protein
MRYETMPHVTRSADAATVLLQLVLACPRRRAKEWAGGTVTHQRPSHTTPAVWVPALLPQSVGLPALRAVLHLQASVLSAGLDSGW